MWELLDAFQIYMTDNKHDHNPALEKKKQKQREKDRIQWRNTNGRFKKWVMLSKSSF